METTNNATGKQCGVRCIDCAKLAFGFNPETDQWVHCDLKHAKDIVRGIKRKQPEITKADAYKTHHCVCFELGSEQRNLDVYNTDINSKSYKMEHKYAVEFQRMLMRKAKEYRTKVMLI
jgi:hypothetical protein